MKLLGGVKGEDYDFFHELILSQEIGRLGTRGYFDGVRILHARRCLEASLCLMSTQLNAGVSRLETVKANWLTRQRHVDRTHAGDELR